MTSRNSSKKSFLPFSRDMAPVDVHLRLLNLTDLHMAIRPYDYFADRETKQGGLVAAAALLARLRGEVANALVFDNGDFLQGNPMGDHAARSLRKDPSACHPMIAALNALKLDAGTLGNHEFNYGLPVLQAALAQATFPVVCANVATKQGKTACEDTTLVPPYRLLTRKVTDRQNRARIIKIGVIGFVPPQILQWDRPHLEDKLRVREIPQTARTLVPKMIAEGADLVVALCHSGIAGQGTTAERENASLALAQVPGIDAIITGHSHSLFPSVTYANLPGVDHELGLLHDKPATMAGFGGSHVGVIDLHLAPEGPTWTVKSARANCRAVPPNNHRNNHLSRKIETASEDAHEKTLTYIRQPVGTTDIPLDSFFAMVTPASSVRIVAAAQAWHMKHKLRNTPLAALPMLSAAAPFKMGGHGGPWHFTHVPKGSIAMRNVADLYVFPNTICALRVSGAALLDWLEYSTGLFKRLQPNKPEQMLVDPKFAAYNFDTITGLRYQIDLSQPARFSHDGTLRSAEYSRIRNLEYADKPVTAEMEFLVVTNSYRAGQSGNFPGADDGTLVFAGEEQHQDILRSYISQTKGDRSLPASPWTFAPLSNTNALFETGPEAVNCLSKTARLQVQLHSETRDGFLIFRKSF